MIHLNIGCTATPLWRENLSPTSIPSSSIPVTSFSFPVSTHIESYWTVDALPKQKFPEQTPLNDRQHSAYDDGWCIHWPHRRPPSPTLSLTVVKTVHYLRDRSCICIFQHFVHSHSTEPPIPSHSTRTRDKKKKQRRRKACLQWRWWWWYRARLQQSALAVELRLYAFFFSWCKFCRPAFFLTADLNFSVHHRRGL